MAKGTNTEIKTAAELIRIAFAWSYAEDSAKESELEQQLKTMIAGLDPDERDRPMGTPASRRSPPRSACHVARSIARSRLSSRCLGHAERLKMAMSRNPPMVDRCSKRGRELARPLTLRTRPRRAAMPRRRLPAGTRQ
jgi:hypothetical protein